MHNIAILSKDYQHFEALLKSSNTLQTHENMRLIFCSDTFDSLPVSDVNILLADPTLAANVVNNCDSLQWLQSTWAGVNALISNEKKNYQLTGLKDVFGHKMSEYVFAYLLYFSRKVSELQSLQQQKIWHQPDFAPLAGSTLGIMGLGNIGNQVATVAKAFGMNVHALTRTTRSELADKCYQTSALFEFANSCDFVLNLLPETNTTKGICNSEFFANMRKGAIFINAGRGSVIDSPTSLIHALDTQHLRAAVIDVFEKEPLPNTHPYYNTQHLMLTNHTAAMSSPEDVFTVFNENLRRYALNQPLQHVVEHSKGY